MTITQPAHPVPPSQPAQPLQVEPPVSNIAAAFSTEPEMHTNAGEEGITQVTVMLDKDSLKIIQDASMVHGESIVNLGIKLFSKTNVYKEFMLKAGTVPLDTTTEDLQTLSQAVADMGKTEQLTGSQGKAVSPTTTPSAPTAGGFQQW